MRKRIQSRVAGARYLVELGILFELAGSLLRAVILARLLPQDQFGLAIALILMMSFVEIVGDIGLDRSAVRIGSHMGIAEQRDTLHAMSLLRGGVLAGFLVATAPLAASVFRAPEAMDAFSLLSIAALLRGAAHLGVKELARDYQFGADGLCSLAFHASTMLLTVIAALVTRSYHAVLFGIIGGQLVNTVLSHYLAPQPWRIRWHRPAAREILHYGIPLIPGGLALALKNIGDRMIVGGILGAAALAVYSVTVMVALMPRGVVLRYVSTIFMPRLVNAGHGAQGMSLVSAMSVLMSLVALVLGLGLWSLGEPVITLVFGAGYSPPQALVGAVSLMMVVKVMTGVVTIAALAYGETRLVLIGSAGSIAGVGLGALALWLTENLTIFVLTMSLSETIALATTLRRGHAQLCLDQLVAGVALLGSIALVGLAIALSAGWLPAGWAARSVASAVLLSAATALFIALMRRRGIDLREFWELIRSKPLPR